MSFDWAHTISSISKLILRAARNADDGGSGAVAQRTAVLRVYAVNLIITS